jgi:hypothetical protein
MESVRKRLEDANYDRKELPGKALLNLKAANHQVIGTSGNLFKPGIQRQGN